MASILSTTERNQVPYSETQSNEGFRCHDVTLRVGPRSGLEDPSYLIKVTALIEASPTSGCMVAQLKAKQRPNRKEKTFGADGARDPGVI